MRYVVYHKDTTKYLCRHPGTKVNHEVFATQAAAKAALTREAKTGAVKKEDFLVADYQTFADNIEKQEERQNIMPPHNKFMVRVNSPRSCDPSSETYWST
jgi:hypothetical protein